MSVGVLIEHRVRPGRRDDVQEVWERVLRTAIEANAAHEAYAYMFDSDDPDAYVTEVESLLVRPPRVLRTDVVWTKLR